VLFHMWIAFVVSESDRLDRITIYSHRTELV